jgi:hypothetical protein
MMPPRTDARYAQARLTVAPYHIIGSPPEPEFDAFIGLVCAALTVPSAVLAFFDGTTMCIKAVAGRPQRNPGVAAQLSSTFEYERTIVAAGDAEFFCSTPVFTADGHAIGVIGGFDQHPHADHTTAPATLEAIAATVTHALEARKRATAGAFAGRSGLIAFDAAQWTVVFTDGETVGRLESSTAGLQSQRFDDIFNGVDADTRHELDVLRDTMRPEALTFTARARGAGGFWFPVVCTARAIRDRRLRAMIVVDCAQPSPPAARPKLQTLLPATSLPVGREEHSINAVLSKIEAGRRALRAEQSEPTEPLTIDAFVSAAGQLVGEGAEPHLLALFACRGDDGLDIIERARRTRLVCDHDLVAFIDGAYLAVLLRDMPVAIGRQAIKRFSRTVSGLRVAVRDTRDPDTGMSQLLAGAMAELRRAT